MHQVTKPVSWLISVLCETSFLTYFLAFRGQFVSLYLVMHRGQSIHYHSIYPLYQELSLGLYAKTKSVQFKRVWVL